MTTSIKVLRKRLDAGELTKADLVGRCVKVGFMTLNVTSYEETPGDWYPNKWHLQSPNGERKYEFTPHNGIRRVFS